VSDCHEFEQVSDICSSGWCVSDGRFTSSGICAEAPVSTTLAPVACTSDAQCTGVANITTIFEGKCGCGFNPTAQAYCSAFVGDPAGVEFVKNFAYFVKSGALQKCNTTRRLVKECWDISKNTGSYKNFIAASTYYNNYE